MPKYIDLSFPEITKDSFLRAAIKALRECPFILYATGGKAADIAYLEKSFTASYSPMEEPPSIYVLNNTKPCNTDILLQIAGVFKNILGTDGEREFHLMFNWHSQEERYFAWTHSVPNDIIFNGLTDPFLRSFHDYSVAGYVRTRIFKTLIPYAYYTGRKEILKEIIKYDNEFKGVLNKALFEAKRKYKRTLSGKISNINSFFALSIKRGCDVYIATRYNYVYRNTTSKIIPMGFSRLVFEEVLRDVGIMPDKKWMLENSNSAINSKIFERRLKRELNKVNPLVINGFDWKDSGITTRVLLKHLGFKTSFGKSPVFHSVLVKYFDMIEQENAAGRYFLKGYNVKEKTPVGVAKRCLGCGRLMVWKNQFSKSY